jgi:hypothetical protein
MYLAETINRPLDRVEPFKYIEDFYALYTNRNVVLALYYSTVKLQQGVIYRTKHASLLKTSYCYTAWFLAVSSTSILHYARSVRK